MFECFFMFVIVVLLSDPAVMTSATSFANALSVQNKS